MNCLFKIAVLYLLIRIIYISGEIVATSEDLEIMGKSYMKAVAL